jgi:hypothetical protein
VATTRDSDLVDALREPGCPACRVLRAAEERYWFFFLHEGFQEPDAVAAVRRSVGYCRRHEAQLAARRDAFALAVLSHAAVVGALERLARGAPRLRRGGADGVGRDCPVCAELARTERGALDRLLAGLADGRLAAAYEASDGVCFDHVRAAPGTPRAGAARLRRDARARLERQRMELDELIGTFDYRAAGAAPEQARAWRRALAALRGDPGAVGVPPAP